MSDNIPLEIQLEIIKKVHDVKSLIRFRCVSKPWKSFIDTPKFIKGYDARHTQPHSHILSYSVDRASKLGFTCLIDDDIETFKVQQQDLAPFVVSPLLEKYCTEFVIGACHGLLCFYGFHLVHYNWMVVIWNPSIGKSFGVVVPSCDPQTFRYGFGVCPVTSDPTIVKFVCEYNHWRVVEVFTLSSGVWKVIGNLPRRFIYLDTLHQVVIDRFIYWGAREIVDGDDGQNTINDVVLSFDLITKEFKVVNLPDSLTNEITLCVSICKLRDSLVVFGQIEVEGALCCGVWVMEHDSSFRKLFTIGAQVDGIIGFKKNGETIFETRKYDEHLTGELHVYDPCSRQIKSLGISGETSTFFMGSYKESLLFLEYLDSHIYNDDNLSIDDDYDITSSQYWNLLYLRR